MATAPLSPDIAPAGCEPVEQGTSLWRDAWHRLARNRLAVVSLGILAVLSIICVLGPLATVLPPAIRPTGLSFSYSEQDLKSRVNPPGVSHWLGTDQLGRDVLARLLLGGRVSLMVGLSATVVALTIGLLYGAISGYLGGNL